MASGSPYSEPTLSGVWTSTKVWGGQAKKWWGRKIPGRISILSNPEGLQKNQFWGTHSEKSSMSLTKKKASVCSSFIHQSIYLYLFIYLSINLLTPLFLCPSLHSFIDASIYLSIYSSISFMHLSIHPFMGLYIYPSIHLIHHQFMQASIYLPIIYSSIYSQTFLEPHLCNIPSLWICCTCCWLGLACSSTSVSLWSPILWEFKVASRWH